MHFSPARWTTAVAAAALIALPGAAWAQSPPPQNPPSQQPPTQTPPPAQSQPQSQPQPQPQSQSDANAAKQHLTEARDALSQLTSMPEAAKLQGEARTKVSELISNFNALITTQSDWHAAYEKVNDSLTALIGADTDQQPPAAGTAGTTGTGTAGTAATGTTGTAGTSGTSSVQLDPAIRGKLVEFRTHLNAFEKAAGGATPAPENAPNAMPPAAATSSTSNPANPTSAANPAANPPANPPAAAAGTSGTTGTGTMGTSGTSGTAAGTASSAPAGTASANVNAAAQSELAAIDAILAKSKTGALTKTQTAELKRHIEALRALLK